MNIINEYNNIKTRYTRIIKINNQYLMCKETKNRIILIVSPGSCDERLTNNMHIKLTYYPKETENRIL